MEINVVDFPEILCGPILRKVTAHQVSVFVVTKNPYWVQLKLYENHVEYTATEISWHEGYEYPLQEMLRLGKHLYVTVVTLDIPKEFSSNTVALHTIAGLVENKIYSYNLYFNSTNVPTNETFSLAKHSLGLLTVAGHQLGFKPNFLPSFSVPPKNFDDLNIFHGSCRKPHGAGRDMLATIDDYLLLHDKYANANERAHLLMLTGDQIYADDVSPLLLKLLHDTANELLGWVEEYPNTAPGVEKIIEMFDPLSASAITLADSITDGSVTEVTYALAALETALTNALESPTDDSMRGRLTKLFIKTQLKSFLSVTKTMVDDAGSYVLEDVKERAEAISDWIETHREIFENLRSDQHWGKVGFSGEKDHSFIHVALARTKTVLDSSATLVTDLYPIVIELLDQDFEDKNLVDEFAFYYTSVNTLQSNTATTVDDLKNLMGDLRDFLDSAEERIFIASRISPPQREKELKLFCGLTSNAMSSHLMFLGEFYMMYVFSWSDVLWYKKEGVGTYVENLPDYKEAVPNYGLTGPLSEWGVGQTTKELKSFLSDLPKVRRVLANVPVMMMFDDHEVTDDWNINEDWVNTVNGRMMGPQFLRNAISAYAIFQDWGNQPDDYRVNSADPDANKGNIILNTLEVNDVGGVITVPALFTDEVIKSKVSRLYGVGDAATFEAIEDYSIVTRVGRKQWDWEYEFYPEEYFFKIIALDTRTHRGFPDEYWRAKYSLFYADVGVAPGNNPSSGGKVAAANLIHIDELSRQLLDRLNDNEVNIVLSPAPVFGLPMVEDLFQRLSALSAGPEVADYEAWQGNPKGFEVLVDTLRRGKDVILLSGDVHYAYSNVIEFNGESESDLKFKLRQYCSSSLKNETVLTRVLGRLGRAGNLLQIIHPDDISWDWVVDTFQEMVGYLSKATTDIKDNLSGLSDFPTWYDETSPLLNPLNAEAYITYYLALKDNALLNIDLALPKGIWETGSGIGNFLFGEMLNYRFWEAEGVYKNEDYTISFLKDHRSFEQKLGPTAALNGRSSASVRNVVDIEQRLSKASEVVGFNNFGRLEFLSSGTNTSMGNASHHLYWKTHDHKANPESTLAETIHGDQSFKLKLAHYAVQEYEKWNPNNDPSQKIKATSSQGLIYWSGYIAAMYPEHKNMPLKSVRGFFGAKEGEYDIAWSALFISYLVKKAGAGDTFFYSSRHVDYVRRAKANRASPVHQPFQLYDSTNDGAPEVGDIIVRSQGDNNSENTTYGDIELTDSEDNPYKLHCDIVVEKSNDALIVIGGNLSESVSRRLPIPIDADGVMEDRAYLIAYIKVGEVN